MKKEAEWAYNFLFSAISQGKTAFDMTDYFPSAPPPTDSMPNLSRRAEIFRVSTTLEERVEIGRRIAALRINADGSKMAW